MTTIQINGDRLTESQVQDAVRAITEDGFVVLANAIPIPIIETLRDRAFADKDALENRPDKPFNWNAGNLQQDPAPFPPYLFREVLANEYAIQVTHPILGDGMFNAFYSGNTALPSKDRQPVHADIGHLWPNQTHVHPPYSIVVNVPLVDVTPENGSTEIWPGTHRDPSVTIQSGQIEVSDAKLEEWRAVAPPIQPTMAAGSILIRDIRLWHAGMPNHTSTPRPMIAMIHYVSWWSCGKFTLHASAEELLKHRVLRQHADFVDGNIDHISSPGGHAYSEEN